MTEKTPRNAVSDTQVIVPPAPPMLKPSHTIDWQREALKRFDDAATTGEQPDMVKSPSHYTSLPARCSGCDKPIECIDVTKHMNFSLGSIVKYAWRIWHKGDPVETLGKIIQYAEFERDRILAERIENS